MTDDVIDLNERRNARERPDADCVRKDDFGRPVYLFTLSWSRDGKDYGTELWAYDEADAQKHVAAMRESLKYDGQIYSIVPL